MTPLPLRPRSPRGGLAARDACRARFRGGGGRPGLHRRLGARCIGAAHDDTAAFQAAINAFYATALGGRCRLTEPLVTKTPGQIFHGDGRARTRIVI